MIQKGKISNGVKSRKFHVWLISLGAVLAIYLLYSHLSETPRIEINTATQPAVDVGEFGSEKIGKVGDVGIGEVEVARFINFNKDKTVNREFGFKKLLHEIGKEWEIEKPYMNIFRRSFKCYITADKGRVQIEDAVGRPSPKDAAFTGNVIIHILPEIGSNIKESFIYLDDIIFISEKSQFSTAGPVKFVSQDTQMLGRGLELVYNDELSRLEFLRIIHLENLRLKTSEEGLFPSRQTDAGSPASTSSQAQIEQPAKPVAAGDRQKLKEIPPESKQAIEQETGEYYRCVFSKNVVINCPEQLIFADEFFVNNIFWSNAPSEKSTKADTGGTDNAKTITEISEESVTSVQSKADTASADSTGLGNVPVTGRSHHDESHKEFVDIVVTCDNGIVVTPMDYPSANRIYAKLKPEDTVTGGKALKNFGDPNGRATFTARRIDYCLIGDKVSLEGDCLCTMLREDPNSQQHYTLSAPKVTVKLSRDKDKRPSDLLPGIDHLTASGGAVQLANAKTAAEQLLGFTKLKCFKFDYDSPQQLFLATGPGLIAVDNSKVTEPKARLDKFSLQRQCYAFLRHFETLTYSLETNRIIADAQSDGTLSIDYIPIVDGKYGQQIVATAGHVEALIYETADGRTELSTLSAVDGITYEEEGKKKGWGKKKDIQFVGSEFFYDHSKSMLSAWGDESRACLLNGTLVDGIEYNLKTGRLKKAKIVAPGLF